MRSYIARNEHNDETSPCSLPMQPTTKVKLHIPVSLKLLKTWRSSFISDYVESLSLSGNLHKCCSQYDTETRPGQLWVVTGVNPSSRVSLTILHSSSTTCPHLFYTRVISLALGPCGFCQIYLETFLLCHQIRREEREVAFPMLPIGDSHQYLKEQ